MKKHFFNIINEARKANPQGADLQKLRARAPFAPLALALALAMAAPAGLLAWQKSSTAEGIPGERKKLPAGSLGAGAMVSRAMDAGDAAPMPGAVGVFTPGGVSLGEARAYYEVRGSPPMTTLMAQEAREAQARLAPMMPGAKGAGAA
jgi:hypothetical protein